MAPKPQVLVSDGYGNYHNLFATAASPRTLFGPVMLTRALDTFNALNLAAHNNIHHLSTRANGQSLLSKLYGAHFDDIPPAPRILIWILTCFLFFGLASLALAGVTMIIWGGYIIIKYIVKQLYKGIEWRFDSFVCGIKNMGKVAGASCKKRWKKLTTRRQTTSWLANSGNTFTPGWSPTGSVDAVAAVEWGREMNTLETDPRVLEPRMLERGVTISVTDVATGQLLSLDLITDEAPADPVLAEWRGRETRSPPPVYSVRG